jgi:adenylosuccinate lyase
VYLLIGLQSTIKGLGKIVLNAKVLENDLDANPELLAEAVQTAMRVFKEENPYEKLKGLTRGRRISTEDISQFVDGLEKIPEALKARMKKLTVSQYTGLAEKLVDHYFSKI